MSLMREWSEEAIDHRNALLYAMGVTEEEAKRKRELEERLKIYQTLG